MSPPETSEQTEVPDLELEVGERAGWEGSDVTPDEIQWLRATRRIPAGVECRLPEGELEPQVQEGERVVFVAHFQRGFGLPVSDFFRSFLDKFGLQVHHLPANAITTLSCIVSFSEGYLGLKATVDLFSRYFQLKRQVIPDPKNKDLPKLLTACGAAIIAPRRNSIFPRIATPDTVRKWLRTWFYVKNSGEEDFLNLPVFNLSPPTEPLNWDYTPPHTGELKSIHGYIAKWRDPEDPENDGKVLTADDLACTFVKRRVSPLQARSHKICHMSGLYDPTRHTHVALDNAAVARRVRAITKSKIPDAWTWGREPHYRTKPAKQVRYSDVFFGTPLPPRSCYRRSP